MKKHQLSPLQIITDAGNLELEETGEPDPELDQTGEIGRRRVTLKNKFFVSIPQDGLKDKHYRKKRMKIL